VKGENKDEDEDEDEGEGDEQCYKRDSEASVSAQR
jgi:hypothetical protein